VSSKNVRDIFSATSIIIKKNYVSVLVEVRLLNHYAFIHNRDPVGCLQ